MAANGFDPVDGSPLFSDTDAPDIKVDPRAAAEYAADVGNRIVRADLAALDAYPYKRAGLKGYALDSKREYAHDGVGWRVSGGDTDWVNITSAGTGWTIASGDLSPQVRRIGDHVFVRGFLVVSGAVSLTTIATLPAGFAPSRATWYTTTRASSGSGYEAFLAVTTGGILQIPTGYTSGSLSVTNLLPLSGQWAI